jgi:multisubunit Na+/H+ antiporter MnhG subunit
MHHRPRPARPQPRKLHRLAAALIILLSANIATMMVMRAASAQPLSTANWTQMAHQEVRFAR